MCLIMLVVLALYVMNNRQIQQLEIHEHSLQLADELRQSSDDLTRMVRTYVVTDNPMYEDQYWKVLAIRNGEIPRPQNYNNIYWDLVIEPRMKPSPDTIATPLRQLMEKAGFTDEELSKLAEAQSNSDNLVETELVAMNAMKGIIDTTVILSPHNGESNQQFAIRILHSSLYHRYKASIMKPIGEFLDLVSIRTHNKIQNTSNNIIRLNISLVILVFLSLLSFANLFHITRLEMASRISSEQKALHSTTHLRTVINSIPDLIWLKDHDGKYITCNYRFELFLGLDEKEIIGRTDYDFFPKERADSFRNNDQKVLDSGLNNVIEEEITFASDGHKELIEITKTYLYDVNRKIVGTLGIGHDITARKAVEYETSKLTEQLHQSQKMEAIGQLAGGIAHDFNNSLGGIISATELLLLVKNNDKKQIKYLELILYAAVRAGELTKKLLLFSRKGVKASSTVDMSKVIGDTKDLLAHVLNKNISISIDNNAENTKIIGDDSQLQNAIMNMAINASQVMPKGGDIVFILANQELDVNYCKASLFDINPGKYIEIIIRDNGSGMSQLTQSHIFEPFFTTKDLGKGTGLGLATVYGTIHDHKGAITVYSEVGTGTVFHIYLPLTDVVSSPTKTENIPLGTGNILLIDDEELIRITAKALLVSLGYNVICAENGLTGVQTFSEKHQEIDLIILDMIMPVMGGRQAFTLIREIDPKIPVIISSGFAKDSEMEELKKHGVSGYIHKPFNRAELARVVSNNIPNIAI
ncbi:MAG: response regulator [Spirochaetaceae bacterium]